MKTERREHGEERVRGQESGTSQRSRPGTFRSGLRPAQLTSRLGLSPGLGRAVTAGNLPPRIPDSKSQPGGQSHYSDYLNKVNR